MEQRARDKNTTSRLTAITLLMFLTVLLSVSGAAQPTPAENENSLEVNVSISEKTIVDIQPKTFGWGYTSTVQPGTIAGPDEESNGYGRIQIENLGSVDIGQLWFNTSYPGQRPFGTGNSNNYDSANFVALDSNTSGRNDHNQFVNRKEYGLDQSNAGQTQDIIYLDTPSNWDYGRFRDSSQEYFWTVDDTETSTTGLQGATFRIGVDPHNESQTGSTNLDNACGGGDEGPGGSNTECNGYNLDVNGDWASTDVEIGALDESNDALPSGDEGKMYCAVMNETQVLQDAASDEDEADRPAVYFVKWNKGFPGTGISDCQTATNYTIGSDGEFNSLTPGQWITQNIRARVPYGVVSAELPTGSLYVLANSQ